jgi:hypothetical protein
MGLNTGSGTQQKQTAECIMKKIHNHHMKKRPSFWTGSLYCVHVLCCCAMLHVLHVLCMLHVLYCRVLLPCVLLHVLWLYYTCCAT